MVKTRCLLSLLLILAALAAAVQVQPPRTLRITVTNPVVGEGSVIDEEVRITIDSPFSANTFLAGELGNITTKRSLKDILEERTIAYEIKEGALEATNPEDVKTFVFNSAGEQYFFLKLPKSSQIDNVTMGIKGLQNSNSYPLTPAFDIGDDGRAEWRFAGSIDSFGSFLLPRGLQENRESGVVYLSNKEEYFCEVVNLTNARDFEVSAKYGYADNTENANLTAVIFSFTSSGNSVSAQGGANTCTLPQPQAGVDYGSCIIRFTTFIQGERMVCVFNKNFGNGNMQQYKLAKDDAPASGYRCDRLQNGQASCQSQIADFFIKAKAGVYSGYLQRQASISEGRTEYILERELKESLNTCSLVDLVNCMVPVSVESRSAGVLYLDDLVVKYRSGGSQFIETNFYDATGTGSYFSRIDTADLELGGNITLTLPSSSLHLAAPAINVNEKNMTLRISLEPGPSDQKSIRVVKGMGNLTGNTTGSPSEVIDKYKSILSALRERYEALFTALGKKTDVDSVLEELDSLRARWQNIANSNRSQGEKNTEQAAILSNVSNLVRSMPRTVVVTKSVSDVIVPSFEDVRLDALMSRQQSEDARQKIYELQEQTTVNGKAEYFEMTLFNDAKEKGTLITKMVSSPLGQGYFVEIIPGSAASANEVSFESAETVRSGDPLILKLESESLSRSISYVIKGDATSKLGDLKTVVVPQVIPEEAPPQHLARCGDGICNAVKVNGEIIPLEDQYSCPEDCRPTYSWSILLIALLLAVAILFYIYYYKGKYSFDKVFNKPSNKPIGGKEGKTLFISKRDEDTLRSYVTSSLNKGFSKQKVSDALVGKGWTQDQVDYIFKTSRK